ncbi:MAG TPA: hypothetical protein VFC79_14240 [Tissierellaceae bacterium]|nr:hypothetical protein [Tissierellaceae bacterium]
MDSILHHVLPDALAIGVPYDLFWVMTPKDLEPFKKAFSLSREINDISNWQLGNYIRIAIASSFNDKTKYPSEPYMYTGRHVEELDEETKLQMGSENNRLVRIKLMERIKKRKSKSSGGDSIE